MKIGGRNTESTALLYQIGATSSNGQVVSKSKMVIELDGSKFGTNNGTTDLMEVSRNLHNKEITSSFRSHNLVGRVGHEVLETIPPTRQQYS